jgi:outer membrane protein OmpA-like peptidoglycan-associated protein/tetratricopeptide (TPR) repeat protein
MSSDYLKKGNLAALFFLIFTTCLKSQYQLKEADEQFSLFNYAIAAKKYEKAYDSKPTIKAVYGLAESNFQMRNYKQAEAWYSKLVDMSGSDQSSKHKYLLRYAETLRNNGKYEEAKIQYQKLVDLKDATTDRTELTDLIKSCDSSLYWMSHPVKLQVLNYSAINSAYSDWGATPYGNEVLFVSDRLQDGLNKNMYGWTGNGYMHLFRASLNGSVSPFDTSNINGAFHTGIVALSHDKQTIILTKTDKSVLRKSYVDGRLLNMVNFILFYTKNSNGVWAKIKPLLLGGQSGIQYSLGDAFLTGDGRRLYFSSNMPGGFGGTDIYYVDQLADGSWSSPVNAGTSINTSGNERCPSFDANGNFYFSSDGLIGMGGLDIYTISAEGLKSGRAPINMGYPINSPQDDLAIRFINGTSGYLSSNRQGGKGSDDIFKFELEDVSRLSHIKLVGKVRNSKTFNPVARAIITLEDNSKDDRRQIFSDTGGGFHIMLDTGKYYHLTVEKNGYRSLTRNGIFYRPSNSTDHADSITIDLNMDSLILDKPQTLFAQIGNVYFDFDQWALKPEMQTEVDRLVQILEENPTLKVEIGAHTDSRGKARYNMKLSQKRAQSVVDYLIEKGIASNRMTARGYGETRPINNCRDGVPCSESEYLLNRRVEFTLSYR